MIKALGYIKAGKLKVAKSELPAFLSLISKQKDKRVEIIVKFGSKRSNQQNAYYWGVIVELIRLGINEMQGENFTKEDIHEFLKNKFLQGEEIVNKEGEVIMIRKSTIDNTKTAQEEYHENCRLFAFEFLNIEIPLPNEQIEFNFE